MSREYLQTWDLGGQHLNTALFQQIRKEIRALEMDPDKCTIVTHFVQKEMFMRDGYALIRYAHSAADPPQEKHSDWIDTGDMSMTEMHVETPKGVILVKNLYVDRAAADGYPDAWKGVTSHA